MNELGLELLSVQTMSDGGEIRDAHSKVGGSVAGSASVCLDSNV